MDIDNYSKSDIAKYAGIIFGVLATVCGLLSTMFEKEEKLMLREAKRKDVSAKQYER